MRSESAVTNKEYAQELEARTRRFAVRIIYLSSKLPHTPEGKAVRDQITRSGTSIGANYREANRARSRADFRNKIGICCSEASETRYWLEILGEIEWLSQEEIRWEYEECGELLAIFDSIGKGLTRESS
jgi:four helix bundle protein